MSVAGKMKRALEMCEMIVLAADPAKDLKSLLDQPLPEPGVLPPSLTSNPIPAPPPIATTEEKTIATPLNLVESAMGSDHRELTRFCHGCAEKNPEQIHRAVSLVLEAVHPLKIAAGILNKGEIDYSSHKNLWHRASERKAARVARGEKFTSMMKR